MLQCLNFEVFIHFFKCQKEKFHCETSDLVVSFAFLPLHASALW